MNWKILHKTDGTVIEIITGFSQKQIKISIILFALAKALRIDFFFYKFGSSLVYLDLINPSAKADGNS